MVAAWIRAETGVGPSIASGSQTYSGNCADFAGGAEEQQQRDHGQDADASRPETAGTSERVDVGEPQRARQCSTTGTCRG